MLQLYLSKIELYLSGKEYSKMIEVGEKAISIFHTTHSKEEVILGIMRVIVISTMHAYFKQ